MGSTTRIDKALRMTQNELFTPENGARGTTAKILIVLTDGSQTPDPDAENPGLIADEIRKTGVSIVAVGVGNGTNLLELDHISGGYYHFYFSISSTPWFLLLAYLHDKILSPLLLFK